ncbi:MULTISPECIES: hypothetical protein [unclassified Streptomyces]
MLNVVTGGDPTEQLAHGHRLPRDERCFRTANSYGQYGSYL